MKIGVLALQGAFVEHTKRLDALGVQSFEIRQKSDLLERMDGLILPGGESTTMVKLLHELCLFDELKAMIDGGLPVFGTCAGLLLLAREIDNRGVTCFASMDIRARRNAYGRQLGSFYTVSEFSGLGKIPMTFIRAPYIESANHDAGVEVLAEVQGQIVAARQKNMLVTAFHPELGESTAVHEYFIRAC